MNTDRSRDVPTSRQRRLALLAVVSAALLVAAVISLTCSTSVYATGTPAPHLYPNAPANIVFLFVDRGDDLNVSTCLDGAPNDCSLRGAIGKANADPGSVYHIYFTPTLTTINLTGTLPTVIMSGTWIVGNSGSPRIDGSSLPNGSSAFVINATNARVGSLSIVNVPSTTATADISITGGTHILIDYNYLGTLPPAGVANCTPSGVTRNAAHGVYVNKAVTGAPGDNNQAAYLIGNTIGCHTSDGIHLAGADHVYIGKAYDGTGQGNLIGVNANNVTLPNQRAGIDLEPAGLDNAHDNDMFANTIAGNAYGGLILSGCNCVNNYDNNWIHHNHIGLAPNGAAVGNGQAGIWLDNGTTNNVIGGSTDGDRNVVSGNSGDGIRLNFADSNYVLKNFIGTNGSGTAALPNTGSGIKLNMSNGNFIGTNGLAALSFPANVISSNSDAGIWLTYSSDNLIGGNIIGGNVSGTLPLGSQGSGILLGVGATNNTVGEYPSAGNLIMGNATGIVLQNSQVATNTIVYNIIRANQTTGVYLGLGTFNNTIGGNSSAAANTISTNNQHGISVSDSPRNQILVNTIDHNAAHGILLTGSGTSSTIISGTILHHNGTGLTECCGAGNNTWSHLSTSNNIGLGIDKNTGPALDLPDPPYLLIDTVNPTTGAVQGRSYNSSFPFYTTVELYRVATNASGYGEGKTFVGSAPTNSSGQWTIVDPVTGGGCYTAFITSINILSGNTGTSEFGANTCQVRLPIVLH